MTPKAPSSLTPVHVARIAATNGWREREFGVSACGIPLRAWWPTTHAPTRVVWGAIHGEEAVTLQLLHQALRQVHADDACAVVVPVLNPDGVLAGTRQNAHGVDLNRNFPSPTWSPSPSPTYWPTATVRTSEHRTQISSPGTQPGSEPEIQAITTLVQETRPELVIDLHTPLECVLAFDDAAVPIAEHLAEPAGLRVQRSLQAPTFGDSSSWCRMHGIVSATYELELAPLPQLWSRHVEAITRMLIERR